MARSVVVPEAGQTLTLGGLTSTHCLAHLDDIIWALSFEEQFDRKVTTLSEKLATRTRVCPASGTTRERAIPILEVPCSSFHLSRILGLPEFCS